MPETITLTVKAIDVRVGDMINTNQNHWQTIDDITNGRKYVTAFSGGKSIMRAEHGDEVLINRTQQTEEEKAAQRLEWRERMISEFIAGYDNDWIEAQTKFANSIMKGWSPEHNSFDYTELAQAQALHAIKDAIYKRQRALTSRKKFDHDKVTMLEEDRDTDVTWVEAFDSYKEDALDELTRHGFRGESRSSSQMSNVLEDIYHYMLARIVTSQYYGI